MYKRTIDLRGLARQKSLLLLGPRQTGKSTLLRQTFPEAAFFDLLESETFRELSARPEYIRQTLKPDQNIVIIDEIQRLPSLLNEVQLLIDRNKDLRVIMTGSSARKLRRGHANLLAGRAWICHLHPLVSPEIGGGRLLDRLNRGGLPGIIDSPAHHEDLKAYVGTYLQEEIRAEGLTRSIENFSRFLEVAGLTHGEQLNYTAVASDAGVPARTIREHYQILVDTLVGHILPAYQKTTKRKPVSVAKFYFFDIGVANTLKKVGSVEPGSEGYGRALEHLLFVELKAYLDYRRLDLPLTFWRTHGGFEVDFLLGDRVAIEVKSKPRVTPADFRGLCALMEEAELRRKILVCHESRRRRTDEGIEIIPVEEFLEDLWNDRLVES